MLSSSEIDEARLTDANLSSLLQEYQLVLEAGLPNSVLFHNREMLLSQRLDEVQAFRQKWQQIAESNFTLAGSSVALRSIMVRNTEKAKERKTLYEAMREAIQLVRACNQLHTDINNLQAPPELNPTISVEFREAVTDFYLEAEDLIFNFLVAEIIEKTLAGCTSERTILTQALINISNICQDPTNPEKVSALSEAIEVMPAHKLGWKTFFQKYLLVLMLSNIFLGVGITVGTTLLTLQTLYDVLGTGGGVTAVMGLMSIGIFATSMIGLFCRDYAESHRSDKELLQNGDLQEKMKNAISVLGRNSIYSIPAENDIQEDPRVDALLSLQYI